MKTIPGLQEIQDWLMHSRRPITRERRKEIIDQLTQESSPGFDYFVLVVLSCVIASLGLLQTPPP